jgi:hypothetical protein
MFRFARGGLVALVAGSALVAATGGAALASPAHVQTETSKTYAATVTFPAPWTRTPGVSFGYDGHSGWIELGAATEPIGLRHTCRTSAAGGDIHIFGQHPHIIYRTIDGRPGCVIRPSADAPRQPIRKGGPEFRTSLAYVTYRHTLRGGYKLLAIWADPTHLREIINSVKVHH